MPDDTRSSNTFFFSMCVLFYCSDAPTTTAGLNSTRGPSSGRAPRDEREIEEERHCAMTSEESSSKEIICYGFNQVRCGVDFFNSSQRQRQRRLTIEDESGVRG